MHLLRNSRGNVKFESYAAISLSGSVHIELDPIAGYYLARARNRTIEGREMIQSETESVVVHLKVHRRIKSR